MATGGTAAAAAKKQVVITTENLLNIAGVTTDSYDETGFQKLQCCAFVEYDGVGGTIRSIEDAVALRRAASGDLSGHEDEDGEPLFVNAMYEGGTDTLGTHKGAVLVTTIPSQHRVYPYLEGAGFKRLGTFLGNAGNQVTIWGAQALQPGKLEPKSETRETVTL